ncbi:MAG: hypothetical protein K0R94_450, partial [Burkholderiales bacterium]|nr:hypothetical protein [Burkholderiales bacterium]
MLKTTYAQDVVNDFLFMKNHIN